MNMSRNRKVLAAIQVLTITVLPACGVSQPQSSTSGSVLGTYIKAQTVKENVSGQQLQIANEVMDGLSATGAQGTWKLLEAACYVGTNAQGTLTSTGGSGDLVVRMDALVPVEGLYITFSKNNINSLSMTKKGCTSFNLVNATFPAKNQMTLVGTKGFGYDPQSCATDIADVQTEVTSLFIKTLNYSVNSNLLVVYNLTSDTTDCNQLGITRGQPVYIFGKQ